MGGKVPNLNILINDVIAPAPQVMLGHLGAILSFLRAMLDHLAAMLDHLGAMLSQLAESIEKAIAVYGFY